MQSTQCPGKCRLAGSIVTNDRYDLSPCCGKTDFGKHRLFFPKDGYLPKLKHQLFFFCTFRILRTHRNFLCEIECAQPHLFSRFVRDLPELIRCVDPGDPPFFQIYDAVCQTHQVIKPVFRHDHSLPLRLDQAQMLF